jgi:predicted MFS family arabinose efflux permease
VDVPGLLTLTGSLGALVYALLRSQENGWQSPVTIGLLAAAAPLLGLFVLAEHLQERPMVDLSLFRVAAFSGVQSAAFLLSLSFFGLFLYLAIYLQNILGYPALQAGLRLLPISVAAFAVAALAGRLSAAVPVRLLLSGGLALIGIGLVLMTRLDAGSGWTACSGSPPRSPSRPRSPHSC